MSGMWKIGARAERPAGKLKLVIIDPQMDFMDHPDRVGSLRVLGAHLDMMRTAALIDRLGESVDEVYVTMDSHQKMDISHPGWWVDKNGNPPAPFQVITLQSALDGEWRAAQASSQERSVEYLRRLKESGRREHRIWPEHCLTGSEGQKPHPELLAAIGRWEAKTGRKAVWVTKGENPFTEHFSALRAEAPDPKDEKTQMNTALADAIALDLGEALLCGEALSHCVAETGRDLAERWGPAGMKKVTLLSDASSSVEGAEADAERFVSDMRALGARVCASADFSPKAARALAA